MAFEKGKSGNPGGRPKAIKGIQELARSYCPSAISALAKIVVDETSPPAAIVSAAVALLDRGYGKPAQPVTGEDGEGPVLHSLKVEFISGSAPVPQIARLPVPT